MVAQKSECTVLRKYRRFVIDGAILKSKPHAGSNAISPCDLCRVAIGDGLALQRPQHEIAVRHAFAVADWQGPRTSCGCLKQTEQKKTSRIEVRKSIILLQA